MRARREHPVVVRMREHRNSNLQLKVADAVHGQAALQKPESDSGADLVDPLTPRTVE